MNASLNLVRGLVRPLVTLAVVAAVCWGFVVGRITPDSFMTLAGGIITWWFVSRERKP